MLEIVAVIFIAAGVFLILRGLTEEYPAERPEWYEEYRQRYRGDYGGYRDYEEYKHEFEDGDKERAKVRGGGVILIGPIPIVFGESRFAVYALILAIILMILSIVFIFMSYRV